VTRTRPGDATPSSPGTAGPAGIPHTRPHPGLGPDGPGLPTEYRVYRWGWAPHGLATRRQLRAEGLRPNGQEPRAEIRWRRGRRVAYLYAVADAAPKRIATPAQLVALGEAMRVRRTCPVCGRDVGYCLPRRWGTCLDCHDTPSWRSAA